MIDTFKTSKIVIIIATWTRNVQVWGIPSAQVVEWEEVWTGGLWDSDPGNEASNRQEHRAGRGECSDGHASQRQT